MEVDPLRGLLLIAGLCEAFVVAAIGGFWLFADTLSIEIGPALALLLGTLIASSSGALTSYLAYKRADESNKKVDKQGETLDVIHHLSNGMLGKALASNKNLARWRADDTGRPEDAAAADEADKQYQEHLENEVKALAAKESP